MQIDNQIHLQMSDAEKAEFEIWKELLESRGYAALLTFLSGQTDAIQATLENPSSWDHHVYARGQRDALNLVFNLEGILEARINELAVADDVDEFEESLEL